MRRRRAVIVQEMLPYYRVELLERLRRSLAAEGVDLDLVHGQAAGARALRRDEATVPWATVVRNRSVGRPGGPTVVWQPALSVVRGADLVVVEHANRQLLNYVLLAGTGARRRPRLALWGHGGNLQSGHPGGVAERFKRWTARLPDWWFAYTEGSAERVVNAGFPRERITVVQNATDTSGYTAAERVPRGAADAVFVGGLHQHKRVELLLTAGRRLATIVPGFRLTVAGDGPLRGSVEAAAGEGWLRYVGPVFGADKTRLFSSASVLLMPGLVGLAALDSFAAGTPLVTVDGRFHSPEFEYLIDGVNAVVLPVGTSAHRYADAVAGLLSDPVTLNNLRAGCRVAADSYTLETMVDRYAEGVCRALDVG